MLPFSILAITGLCIFLAFLIRHYLGSVHKKRHLGIPGLDPSDSRLGNLTDIAQSGSFHQFLRSLHQRYGNIASFWFGEQYVVSTAHPDAFRPQLRLSYRPCFMFQLFEPLFGKSIQYLNDKGQNLRRQTDQYFGHEYCCASLPKLVECAKEVERTWTKMTETGELIPLRQHMIALALRGITVTAFGDYLQDEHVRYEAERCYDVCWTEMESRIAGDIPAEDSERERSFQRAREFIRSLIRKIVIDRQSKENEDRIFVDDLWDLISPEEEAIDMAITYIIAGFHTTGNLMTWMLYFLAKDDDAVDRVLEELNEVIGDGNDISPHAINDLRYCRQVIDESLRLSVLAPWAARYAETDMKIGGYSIPKQTPIVQSLGFVSESEQLWDDPERFDPDRFAPAKAKHMDSLSCPFFGFAGKRKCTGYRFAYFEALAFMSVLLRRFKILLADPEKEVVRKYGFVTHPEEEIYVRVEMR